VRLNSRCPKVGAFRDGELCARYGQGGRQKWAICHLVRQLATITSYQSLRSTDEQIEQIEVKWRMMVDPAMLSARSSQSGTQQRRII
jgi:hypothetical protein